MKRYLCSTILSATLVTALAALGCGSDDESSATPGTPIITEEDAGADAQMTEDAYTPDPEAQPALEFVSSQSQTLLFEKSVDLTVRYVDKRDGSAISSAPLDFAIEGSAEGSTLSAQRASTDASGKATVKLTSGSTNTSFKVKVVPPANGGDPISFNVVVSDTPLGSMKVEMGYLGEVTDLKVFIPRLYKGVKCDDLQKNPDAMPTPLMTTDPALDSVDDTTTFTALDLGTDYVVAVTAAKVGTKVRAFGCEENIEVKQNQETLVSVGLIDLDWPGPVLGTYKLDNRLDFGGTLPSSVDLAVNILDELTDDDDINGNAITEDWGQDPGAFITDFVMRQTCAWECNPTDTYDTCTPINHEYGDISMLYLQDFTSWNHGRPRFTGGCGIWEFAHTFVQDQINTQLQNLLPEAVFAFAEIGGDIARAINKAHIYSELVVQEGSDITVPTKHKLVEMEVLLHDLQGNEKIYKFNLADAGMTSIETNADLIVNDMDVEIPEHEFKLSYGKLVQYIYLHGVLPMFGYASSAELFASFVNCQTMGQWLADNVGIMPADTYEQYCDIGIQLAGDTFDEKLAGFIKAEGSMKLKGTCTAADLDINEIAHTLKNGVWMGKWGEEGDPIGGLITGSFTGTLQ